MKKFLTIYIILFSIFSFGQNLKEIKKEVDNINHISNFKVKIVPNDYFVKIKGQSKVQELKGFYQNNQLKKMVHTIGLTSYYSNITEYYFENGVLICVVQKKFQKIEYDKLNKMSEKTFYFKSGKQILKKGNSENKTNFNEEAKVLKKDLENNYE